MRVAFAITRAKEASLQAFGTTAAGAGFMYASTQTLTIPILDDDATGETEYFVRRPHPPPNPTSATPAAGATDALVYTRDDDASTPGPYTGPEPIAELLNGIPFSDTTQINSAQIVAFDAPTKRLFVANSIGGKPNTL